MFKPIPKLDYAEFWNIPSDGSRPTWKKPFNKMAPIKIGNYVGSLKPATGNCFRIKVQINGKSYFLSRILYWFYNGEDPIYNYIDHADGNTLNNAKDNLRKVTIEESSRNRTLKPSATGVVGVCKEVVGNYVRYKVSVGKFYNNRSKFKSFTDLFEAICYRKSCEYKFKFDEIKSKRIKK